MNIPENDLLSLFKLFSGKHKTDEEWAKDIKSFKTKTLLHYYSEPSVEEIGDEYIEICKKFALNGYTEYSVVLKTLISLYIDMFTTNPIFDTTVRFNIILLLLRLSYSPINKTDMKIDRDKLFSLLNRNVSMEKEEKQIIQTPFDNIITHSLDETDSEISSCLDLDINNSVLLPTVESETDENKIDAISQFDEYTFKVPMYACYWTRSRYHLMPSHATPYTLDRSLHKNAMLISEYEILRECVWILTGLHSACFHLHQNKIQIINHVSLLHVTRNCLIELTLKITSLSSQIREIIRFTHDFNTENTIISTFHQFTKTFIQQWRLFMSRLERQILKNVISSIVQLYQYLDNIIYTVQILHHAVTLMRNTVSYNPMLLLDYIYKCSKLSSPFHCHFHHSFISCLFLTSYDEFLNILSVYIHTGEIESNFITGADSQPTDNLIRTTIFDSNLVFNEILFPRRDEVVGCGELCRIVQNIISTNDGEFSIPKNMLRPLITESNDEWVRIFKNLTFDTSSIDVHKRISIEWECSGNIVPLLVKIQRHVFPLILHRFEHISSMLMDIVKNDCGLAKHLENINGLYLMSWSSEMRQFQLYTRANNFNKSRFSAELNANLYQRFRGRVDQIISVKAPKSNNNAYAPYRLKYKIPAPLNTIFTKQTFRQLNDCHQFLTLVTSTIDILASLNIRLSASVKPFILTRWKLVNFFTGLNCCVMDRINLLHLPNTMAKIEKSSTMTEFTKNINEFIHDAARVTFSKKSAALVRICVYTLATEVRTLATIWPKGGECAQSDMAKDLMRKCDEKMEFIKDYITVIAQSLGKEYVTEILVRI